MKKKFVCIIMFLLVFCFNFSMAVELTNRNKTLSNDDILTCCDVIMAKYGTMKDPISNWVSSGTLTYNQIMTNILSKQCFAYVVIKSGNNSYYSSRIRGFTKTFNGSPSTTNLTGQYIYEISRNTSSGSRGYYYTSDSSYIIPTGNLYYILYCDENRNLWEYSNSDFTVMDSLGPSIDFDDYSDGTIDVYYNGSSDTFLKYNLSRSVNSWALGKITGYDDSLKIDVRLNRYMNGEFTTNVGHAQWYNGQFSTFGGLSITGDGVVYINNDKIYYEQGYYLTIDLDGENILNYPIYFLPYASTLVSGDLLSPDIDTNNDLEILQNLQELVNIQNIGSIYDSNFSGDSGDVLLGTLDYKEYNNDYSNYISTTLMSLREYMLGSGDVAFSFNFMGNNMTVHSNDFYVPDGVLKFFVSSFLVFATGYYLFVQVSHFFHKLQEGDFESALETYAVNDESVLM